VFSIIFRQRVGNEADAPFGETYAVSGAPQTLFSNQNSDVDADLSDSLLGNYTELHRTWLSRSFRVALRANLHDCVFPPLRRLAHHNSDCCAPRRSLPDKSAVRGRICKLCKERSNGKSSGFC